MSITSALNIATSGLSVTARSAALVSDNIANALNPDYSRREAVLEAELRNGVGAGVRYGGAARAENPLATSDRRLAEADAAAARAEADALSRIAAILGAPGEAGALAGRLQGLEDALSLAADTPESGAAQAAVLDAALSVAAGFGAAAGELDKMRAGADAEIARQVDQLNTALAEVHELNVDIQARTTLGGDVAALEDQRKAAIDRISAIIPVQIHTRAGGQVALQVKGGAMLLDGKPGEVAFTPTPVITADMTRDSGALSGLTLNGQPVSVGREDGSGLMDGGSLGAQFVLRDTTVPEAIAQLDALALDLYDRFADGGVDPYLAAGAPGLFTDGGGAYDPAAPEGFAGRIAVNALVDPAQGGELWRLRDGMGAPVQGASGSSAILSAMVDAMRDPRSPAGLPAGAALGAVGLAGDLSGLYANTADAAETGAAYASARAATFLEAERALIGVDTDTELQTLLLIEQAYAANAQVIQTAEQMLDDLMSIKR